MNQARGRQGLPRVFQILVALLVSIPLACSSARHHPAPMSLPAAPRPQHAHESGAAIGVVFGGGGSFGAWEVGALLAFFDEWYRTYGEVPPIRVVAGTSTGALIAPFALLAADEGRSRIADLAHWYTSIETGDVAAPRWTLLLPLPMFAAVSPSVYRVGTDGSGSSSHLLYGLLKDALADDELQRLSAAWPRLRLAVASTDFSDGRPNVFTNQVQDPGLLCRAVMSSAMAPFAFPPIDLPSQTLGSATPHMDGGVFAVLPAQAMFKVAALEPTIHLTHVVVVSAFPPFPGDDEGAVQPKRFPDKPKFGDIGDRFTTLFSEAGAEKDLSLVRAAIALRQAGNGAAEVENLTGIGITGTPPILVELRPRSRLGWQALRFDREEMRAMLQRGYDEAVATLRSGRLDG